MYNINRQNLRREYAREKYQMYASGHIVVVHGWWTDSVIMFVGLLTLAISSN
jgi:hypothetical protein